MPAPSTPPSVPLFTPDELLPTLLSVSLTGIILFRPVYAPAGPATILDLAYVQLNAAAQRMLALPEHPTVTFLARYPHAADAGIFAFYRDTFLSGQPGRYDVNYQHDGLDNYFHLSAQRSGELLVVSFTDTADQPRTAVEVALRESQAREQTLRAEAEQQRQRLEVLFAEAPALIARLTGPDHVVTQANDSFQRLFGNRELLGKPYRDALPELAAQSFFDLLDVVYRTGETYHGTETLARIDSTASGQLQDYYFDFIYQATHDAAGAVSGIIVFAHDVTEKVLARRQVQRMNEDLAAANEEFQRNNAQLLMAQRELRELNQELEARVQTRTEEARIARDTAEQQEQRLKRFFQQAPAAICVLNGPELVYELVNPGYQALFPGRRLLGHPILHALPEIADHAVYHTFRQVYETGVTHEELGILIPLARPADGVLEDRYFNYIQQARTDEHGRVDGVLVFAFEVTTQVRANQRAEALQAEVLAATQRQAQERETLYQVFEQTPALVALLRGPEHRMDYHNAAYQQLFPTRQLLGRTITETQPDAVEQGFVVLLDQVYQTGAPYFGHEIALAIAQPDGQPPRTTYFNFTYQPFRENGQTVGISVFAFDITEQVLARRQAEALQAEVLATTQRQAQERENFYQIFEHTPAAICIQRGPEHRYEYFNPAYQAFFPERALQGLPVAEALPEIVPAGILALLNRVYETGETYFGHEVPLLIDQPGGRPPRQMYFTFTYQAYREDGEIVGISTFAYEVSAQVLQRQQHETQLREIFAQAPVAICVFRGPDYVLDVVNPPMGRMLGHPVAQLMGRPFFEAVPELANQGLRELLDEVGSTDIPFVAQEREVQLEQHRPSQPGHYNFVYQPLRGADDQLTGITCVALDVSEQVRARRVVEEREQYFRQMTDGVPVMIWVTDPTGYCTYLNQPWYTFTGQPETDALGIGWTTAIHPEEQAAAKAAFLAANARQEAFRCLYRLRRADGEYRWVVDTGLPHFSSGGTYEGLIGTVVDVHEQKLAEQALAEISRNLREARDQAQSLNTELTTTNQQLVRTNTDLDTFVYTASHDLKAPITNIEGLLDTLLAELPAGSHTQEVDYILGLMHDSVNRFKKTVEQLTDVSRLQQEHGQPVSMVGLAEVLEDVRLDLVPLLTETGGRLDIDVAACPTVAFSEKHMRSVLYNLLSNALKYRHPDRPPHVRVRCRPEAAHAVLTVQDNGLGLSEPENPRLFNLFQRFHSHVEGSGVGLYMIKKMIENAGGRISVESQENVGSTFSVYFPVLPA
jgi:two-component system, sensor histidine kinase